MSEFCFIHLLSHLGAALTIYLYKLYSLILFLKNKIYISAAPRKVRRLQKATVDWLRAPPDLLTFLSEAATLLCERLSQHQQILFT